MNTKGLQSKTTYVNSINLNDGTAINFYFTGK
jgi:hypothetical protein